MERLSGALPTWYACVPAESTSTWSASPASSSLARNTASAVGERQMLPMHTNSTATLASSAGPAGPWLTGEVDIRCMLPAARVAALAPIVIWQTIGRFHAAFTPLRSPGSGTPVLRHGPEHGLALPAGQRPAHRCVRAPQRAAT